MDYEYAQAIEKYIYCVCNLFQYGLSLNIYHRPITSLTLKKAGGGGVGAESAPP